MSDGTSRSQFALPWLPVGWSILFCLLTFLSFACSSIYIHLFLIDLCELFMHKRILTFWCNVRNISPSLSFVFYIRLWFLGCTEAFNLLFISLFHSDVSYCLCLENPSYPGFHCPLHFLLLARWFHFIDSTCYPVLSYLSSL